MNIDNFKFSFQAKNTMNNILIISPYLPWPLRSGGNTGVYYMLEYICKYENVYFLTSYNKKSNNYKCFEQLKSKLPNINFFMYDYRKTKYKRYEIVRKIVRHIGLKTRFGEAQCNMSNLNSSVESITPGFIEYVNTIIAENNINIVQIEFLGFHSLVYALPNTVKKIFIHHELGWVRNELTYGNDLYSSFYKKYFKRLEISILNNYDIVAALTTIDRKKLIDEGVTSDLRVSTLAISNKTLSYRKHKFNGHLTFIGGSGHFPNLDGIRWFVGNVMPLVTKKYPNVILDVIGSWSDEAIKTVESINNNVKFLGFVDDLGEALQNTLMVVPINIGSGMRMKILEAANYSVPFVSTIVGVEGLDFIDGQDCFISKSSEMMAQHIIQLIEDNALYDEFSINVHKTFEQKYSIESLGKQRLALYGYDE